MKIPEAKNRLEELHSRDIEYKTKIRKLVNKRTELAKANASLSSILEELFQLKEEERRIHRERITLDKATKILNLRPCILDYAVNFGMVDTEKQWHRHLLENGNLTAPVSFDGDYYCDA
jgi:chromosome segregation ATPase